MQDIRSEEWRQIVPINFPFASYEFLLALELSGSIGKGTGWHPQYLTIWQGESLLGCLILYEKTDSYGEYIFDWDWANAYQRYGKVYYPKLTSAIPFTPATGPKLLIRPSCNEPELTELLLDQAKILSAEQNSSSLHHLFIPAASISLYEKSKYKIRKSFQYHWQNKKYSDFENFLTCLKSRKAKQIRKERREVKESSVVIHQLRGEQLRPEHADIFYRFYLMTIDKKQAIPYLTKGFFQMIFSKMPEQLVLLLAESQGNWVAGSLSFLGSETLFGRYWGTLTEYKFLHFELCYYQLIEYCIQHGFKIFEAGAQGEHKIQRGFLPTLTYSAHFIESPEFARAIYDFIDRETTSVEQMIEELMEYSPYRAL